MKHKTKKHNIRTWRNGCTIATKRARNNNGKNWNITAACPNRLAQIIKMDALLNRRSISEHVLLILANHYAHLA